MHLLKLGGESRGMRSPANGSRAPRNVCGGGPPGTYSLVPTTTSGSPCRVRVPRVAGEPAQRVAEDASPPVGDVRPLGRRLSQV
jgi:hypothetical protein